MTVRERVAEAVRQRRFDELETIVAGDRRAIRHLVALTYRPEPELREAASRGLALAARSHPKAVQEVARRLIWAMNEESGANALNAPEPLRAIAQERPDILVALVPDMMRLTADPGLKERMSEIVTIVARAHRGVTVRVMERSLEKCMLGGDE